MTKIQELGAKRFGKKSTMAYMHRIQNEIQPIIGIRNIYRLPMDPETKKKWMDKSILMDFEIDSDSDSDSDSSKMTSSESSDESDSEFQSKSKSSIKKNDSTNQVITYINSLIF